MTNKDKIDRKSVGGGQKLGCDSCKGIFVQAVQTARPGPTTTICMLINVASLAMALALGIHLALGYRQKQILKDPTIPHMMALKHTSTIDIAP